MRVPFAALLLLAACAEERAGAPPAPPVAPQAAVVIEPPQLRIGDVAVVEVVVATPPGARVGPIRAPDPLPGLWLLDSEALPTDTEAAREVRRTRFRVRARETGAFAWPALEIAVEDAEGHATTLTTEPRPFEVVSILPAASDRSEPFSYRLPAPEGGVSPLAVAVAGVAGAVLALAGVALARQARGRTGTRREAAAGGDERPWVEALAALAEARALADSDWRLASGLGARALKRYATRRYRLPLAARTTEEVAAFAPAPLLEARWRAALACLEALDVDRFRRDSGEGAAPRVCAALDAAERWVRTSMPREEQP